MADTTEEVIAKCQTKIKRKFIFVFIIIIGALISISIIAFNKAEKNKKELARQVAVSEQIKQDRENKITEIIKKYILDNSDRISNKMANEIALVISKKKMPIILLAIMKIESTFNPTALSFKGALGLGQIMPVHVKQLISLKYIESQRDLFDIEANINSTEYIWTSMWNKNKGNIIETLTNYYGANDSIYQNKFFKEYFKVKYLLQNYLSCDHIIIGDK